jgi:hypothetical protein
MLGKHLRKLASILTSRKTRKFTLKANILRPGTTTLGLATVSDCNAMHKDIMLINFQTKMIMPYELKWME